MRVLWITNLLLPEMQQHLGVSNSPFGGWISSAANIIKQKDGIELAVASVSPLVHDLCYYSSENINHFAIPYGKGNLIYNPDYENYWKKIETEFSPDLVHIFGTEFTHGLSYVRACGANKVVVSIQGLLSVIVRYYHGGLTWKEILRNTTLRDVFCHTGIWFDKITYKKRSECEIELLQKVNYIIGRTSWDKDHSLAINPQTSYYLVNETLRNEFYSGEWRYTNCKKHSIFICSGGSPIKGLHMVIKALPFVLEKYPDTTLRVVGNDITKKNSIIDYLKQTGYSRYVNRLINKLNLTDSISFLGTLDVNEMKNEYLLANVFVCPSIIENSPNSLGEAQMLGVPCIASYVGGIPDMMMGNEGNLYRYEEVEMLAAKICAVFEKKENQISGSNNAKLRHDGQNNAKELLLVYNDILKR